MRRKKKSELRVFKLRSGEEIIAKVSGKSKDKIKLLRPMRIMNNIQTDPYSGVKRHVIFFSDWLGSSAEIEADIPLDFIVVELPPDADMISLYTRQTEHDDLNAGKPAAVVPPELPLEMSEEEMQRLSDDVDRKLEEMIKQLAREDVHGATGNGENTLPMGMPFPSPFQMPKLPPMPPRGDGILFSVSIPSDILSSWVESGFIDYLKDSVQDFISTEFMEEMMNDERDSLPQKPKKKRNKREKISKDEWIEPLDELKKKPNYGNSHEDWSPYLKDYLPDSEPPQPEPPKNEEEG